MLYVVLIHLQASYADFSLKAPTSEQMQGLGGLFASEPHDVLF